MVAEDTSLLVHIGVGLEEKDTPGPWSSGPTPVGRTFQGAGAFQIDWSLSPLTPNPLCLDTLWLPSLARPGLTIMPWGICSTTLIPLLFLVAKLNSQCPLLSKIEFQSP